LNLLLSGFPFGRNERNKPGVLKRPLLDVGVAMRTFVIGAGALALATMLESATVRAYDLPYDPYPWCAVYSDDAGGASNCGFLTIEQCRATESGIGGFCEPTSSAIQGGQLRAPATAALARGSRVFETPRRIRRRRVA
jgi:hypothetical protein